VGSGFKTFTAGSVLTASDVQNYLQDQAVMVFGGTAARSSAIGTANFEEGMLTYLTDVDKLQVYTGSSFQDVYPPAATSQGMTLINTTSFSAVASQSINNVFNTTYDDYQILIDAIPSTTADFTFRFRVSGSDNSTANYDRQFFAANGTGLSGGRSTGQTSWVLNGGALNNRHFYQIIIANPALALNKTAIESISANYDSASSIVYSTSAYSFKATTLFDGFSLITSTGTMTGRVSVYGVNK
jgi:hypothetical protein